MVFGKSRLELKVGIFVFSGLVFLVFFVLMIGNFKTWGSARNINVVFTFINGVKIGAPVRFAGVDIGEVREINFISNPQEKKTSVKVVCRVRNDINIPADSVIWVNTLGLLGEKYIEIMAGSDYDHYLGDDAFLIGRDPIAMHEVAELAKKIAGDIEEGMAKIKDGKGTIGKLLYDDTVYKEIEAMVIDLRRHPWKLFWKTKEKPLPKK